MTGSKYGATSVAFYVPDNGIIVYRNAEDIIKTFIFCVKLVSLY